MRQFFANALADGRVFTVWRVASGPHDVAHWAQAALEFGWHVQAAWESPLGIEHYILFRYEAP